MAVHEVSPALTAATFGLSPVLSFSLLGLLVNRLVDFLRNGFDKTDRIPKAIWLLVAWGLGIAIAFIITSVNSMEAFFGLTAMEKNTAITAILFGMGFGSVGGFWHELLSRLSGAPAPTPKGFSPRKP